MFGNCGFVMIVFYQFPVFVIPKPLGSFRNRAGKLELKTTEFGKGISLETIESQNAARIALFGTPNRVEEEARAAGRVRGHGKSGW